MSGASSGADYSPRLSAASEPRAIVAILALLAGDIDAEVGRIELASMGVAQDLLASDPLVLEMVRMVADGTIPLTPELSAALKSIRSLDTAAEEAFVPTRDLAAKFEQYSALSSALRRPFRRLNASLQRILDVRQILSNWRVKIDEILDNPAAPPEN